MSQKKPTTPVIGYVVDNKTAKARHAVSAANFNPKIHDMVRPLKPGETVLGYRPRRITSKEADEQVSQAQAPASSPASPTQVSK